MEHSFANLQQEQQRPNIFQILSNMQSKLDELTEIVDSKANKQALIPQKLKLIQEMKSKHQNQIELQIINNNQKIIRMLEQQRLHQQIRQRIKRNQEQIQMIQEEKKRLDIRQQNIQFQRLKIEQQKKQLRWKVSESKRKQMKKQNMFKMKGQIQNIKHKIREKIGYTDQTTLSNHDSQSSFFVQLNQQMNKIRDQSQYELLKHKYIIATVDGKASTRQSGKNTPSIEAIKQMSLLSPLHMVLSINDSRKYSFSEQSSCIYNALQIHYY